MWTIDWNSLKDMSRVGPQKNPVTTPFNDYDSRAPLHVNESTIQL